ncbi:MAG TPA: polymer-forming cytoskeletal protein [Candidatus Thermoplasmatota archaeon]|jgi:predicted acyltransferase (DUF342 family)|nr:polymer-forming cytoskeletal protein [Candidatus Thermoplasmatota archaeon]
MSRAAGLQPRLAGTRPTGSHFPAWSNQRPGCRTPFDKLTLTLPAGTRFEEHTILAPADIIVGDGAKVTYSLHTPARVFLGEKVELGGDVVAGGDVRADHFSVIKGDVRAGMGAYLGENVRVEGKLKAQDLDVGDSVEIVGGFEAKGWVSIRNPIPVVMYLFIYLLQLLGQGRSEEVERILKELEESDDGPIVVGQGYLYVPAGSTLGLQEAHVKGNLDIGAATRVLGNFDVEGWGRVERGATLVGALRAALDIHVEADSAIEGDLECRGTLHLGPGARVAGSIEARKVSMAQTAKIEGTVQAKEGIAFVSAASEAMAQKVEDVRSGRVEVQGLLHP